MAELCGYEVSSIKTESECDESEWCSELDHIPLIQRREMLLANRSSSCRNKIKPTSHNNAVIEQRTKRCGLQVSDSEVNTDFNELEKVDATATVIPQNPMIEKPPKIEIDDIDNLQGPLMFDVTSGSPAADMQVQQLKSNDCNDCTDDLDNLVLKQRLKMLPSRKLLGLAKQFHEERPVELSSIGRLDDLPASIDNTTNSTLEVKSEPLDDVLENPKQSVAHDYLFSLAHIKNEPEFINAHEDMVDHVQLGDRMKIQTVGEDSELKKFDSLMRTVHTAVECGPTVSETLKPIRISRPRKRKKTATDSVETALQEDAPGLLQVLIGEGISVDEIKLYGEAESNELIDDSFIEDEFTELESVISKLFFQRSSLLKLTPMQCPKGSKHSYCLGCLFSLVEQTRYLQFRNWPAEWGWCRDLQSFIFVFERHQRVVLERPEYGYATYFFELVGSLPVEWQIKRLVTAMKLTNCGRITLIENKGLMVGEDLTEGEAQVLMQFGWIPNSGLGTMLNYCDRVVHDRKNEKDASEWRSKIAKLLVDGYNGGSIVSDVVTVKAMERRESESSQTKVEL